MQEAISLSTDIENKIKSKVYEIFVLLKEDRNRLDGSVAINSWGDTYTSEDTFEALAGFLESIAFNEREKKYILRTYERKIDEGDYSLKLRDTIADIFEASLHDAALVAFVRGWKDNFDEEHVLKGLTKWYDENGKTLMRIRA